MTTTADRIRRIVAALLDADIEKVTPDTTLADLGADSLDEIELVMDAEDEFDIVVGDDEAEACRTVGDVIALVERKLGA